MPGEQQPTEWKGNDFFTVSQAPGFVADSLVITAAGAALAGLGLGIAVFFHSPLDQPPWGYIDEGVDAFSFGFSAMATATEAAT